MSARRGIIAGMGELRIGTASWTDKTLLESGWYPGDAATPEKRLAYYASQFPVVEVDATYYNPPNERNSDLWAARTPEDFRFDIKAYGLLTGHPVKVASLYKDLRPETDKKNVYGTDLDPKVVDEVWQRFLDALAPLHHAGKLGHVLFQFPPWFVISKANKAYLLEVSERCKPARAVVEFRHESWLREDNVHETLDFLTSYGIPYVCVDMPQGHKSSVPPILAVTSDLAVVRFHGHSDKWTSKDIYERFGYEYSQQELADWAPKIAALAEEAKETHVLMNNCYRDYATTNARQLAQQIDLLAHR
ncbi:MAG: hypothetical protein QOF57_2766 [Frankiaceae bacterium]|nr:hypothetical protein [Frankiaceae bacterium]MDQ1727639.1 hypothetical protein [Frankiaceae bacterium]